MYEADGEFKVIEDVLEEDEVDGDSDDEKPSWIAETEASEIGETPAITDVSESGMESFPITEDDRRVELALPDLHMQGGSTKSKHPEEDSTVRDELRAYPILLDAPHWGRDIEEET